jgi:hypothetical protein
MGGGRNLRRVIRGGRPGLYRRLLEVLPIEPVAFSLWEFAHDLLGRCDPFARGLVRGALLQAEVALGGIYQTCGDDDLGHRAVPMYGARRQDRPALAQLLARGRPPAARSPRPICQVPNSDARGA